MSQMLASVGNLEEARLVRRLNVDIIDLKQPARGALGALDTESVREIVGALQTCRISATVGDLPMQAELLCPAVEAMAATGVDYVKIGFFPGGDWPGCIGGLSELARRGHALIGVLFADAGPDFSRVEALAAAGFHGVMLDTMDKRGGSLTQLLSEAKLREFVDKGKGSSLLTGLAGSLKAADIQGLLPLKADYLGFRGALCLNNSRISKLDAARVQLIKGLMAGSAESHGLGFDR